MPAIVQSNVGLFIGTSEFTGITNRLELTYGIDLLDATTFSNDVVAHRTRLPGLFNIGLNFSGFWDSDKDLAAHGFIGVENLLTSIVENASLARNSNVYITEMNAAELSRGGPVGDILPFSISAQGNNRLRKGKTLTGHPTNYGASGNGGFVGPIDAPNTGDITFLDIHVLSVSGTSPTLDLVIQRDSSQGFGSPIELFGPTSVPLVQITDLNAPATFRYQTQVDHTDTIYRINRTVSGAGANFTVLASLSMSPS